MIISYLKIFYMNFWNTGFNRINSIEIFYVTAYKFWRKNTRNPTPWKR
jgi:hypothetical protein